MLDRPIFVVGCPRSGTTLLSVMLDRHSALAMTPETAFYDEIAPRMSDGGPADLRDLMAAWPRLAELGLTVEAVMTRIPARPSRARLLEALLTAYADLHGKPYGGEKTPQHLWRVSTILDDFPHARIVCMVRDGRDVALSLAAMPWWSDDLAAAARMWLAADQRRQDCERAYPRGFMSLRYEDLTAAPQPTLTRVMTFLGLAFEPRQLAAGRRSDVVLERTFAWKGQALEAVDPGLGGRRRRGARREDLSFLDHELGEALVRTGYAAADRDDARAAPPPP